MGLEQKTTARHGRKSYDGKLYLDSKTLTFRSKEFKWIGDLGSALQASSKADDLIIQSGKQKLVFDIGKGVSKWVEKINNPPNRVVKLGIKPEHRFWLSSGFGRAFAGELKATGASATRKPENCDIAFWKVTHRKQLDEFQDLADQLEPGVNLWVVWTKGSEAISQGDVMKQARVCGMGPSKTAAFDEDHSSMRFARKKK